MIGSSVSHYRIIEKLGAGGMGEVYAAEDQHLGRLVAIKFPTPQTDGGEFVRRFQHEARAASRLAHRHIARVYDYGESPDGRPFLVMELVRGTTVRELLRQGRIEPARACAIVSGVLEALEYAHAHGLIHRDVKPANIMVEPDGTVKVLDFGLAKAPAAGLDGGAPDPAEAETATGGLTAPGMAPGTPAYMSPEQARGEAVDARSDLFSVGVLLYRCVTGVGPFTGATKRALLDSVLGTEPVPPSAIVPDLDKDFDRVLAKALRKDPAHRYQSAAEMLADVQELREAFTSTPLRRLVIAIGGSTRRIALTALAAVVIVVVVVLVARRWGEHEPSPQAAEWYRRGADALRDGTYYAAARMLQAAVDADKDFALAHARLAEAASELDDSVRAGREMLAALPRGTAGLPRGTPGIYIDAIYRTLTSDFHGAADLYQKLSTTLQGADQAAALVDLGRAYEKDGQVEKALSAYRAAAAQDPSNAAASLHVGVVLGRARNKSYGEALDRAFALYQRLSNAEGQAEVLYQRGLLLSSVDLPAAKSALERARDMAKAIPSEQQEIAATLQLSTIAYLTGDLLGAERMAADGVARAQQAGMNYLAARGLANKGNEQFGKRDWRGAEASYRESLDVSRHYGLKRTEARALFGLANVHQTVGPADAAIQEGEAAVAYFRQNGFKIETIQCLLVLARTHRDLGQGDEAAANFDELLKTAREMADTPRALLAEQGLATVYSLYGRWPEALAAFERYRASAAAANDQDHVSRALTGAGLLLLRLGRYAEAGPALDEADRASEKAGTHAEREPTMTVRRAEMALTQGHHADAAAMGRRVFESKAAAPSLGNSARCLTGLAMARAGQAAAGRQLCEPALGALVKAGDRFAVMEARLRLAEIRLDAGDATGAADDARAVVESAAQVKDSETGWRASALSARALKRSGHAAEATVAARHAAETLAALHWDAAATQGYLSRPDIAALKREIENQ